MNLKSDACESFSDSIGRIVGFAYLAGNDGCSDVWNCTPVVCSASTDGTVKAWDIHKVLHAFLFI